MNTRSKKAFLNIVSTAALEIISFICSMILPRMILAFYGSAYNGIVTSITQYLSICALLRLGVAGAVRASLYKTLASNDIKGTSSIINATNKYMHKVSFLIVLYVIILSWTLPYILKSNIIAQDISFLVIAIGVGTFAENFFGVVNYALVNADQRLYISNYASIITVLLNTVISCILIVNGFSLQHVKFCCALIFLLVPLVLNIYCKKIYSIDSSCEANDSVLRKRKDAMWHSIANIVYENTGILLLTVFCDVMQVSVYSIYRLVMSGLSKILGVFTSGTEPIFGNMWANDEKVHVKNFLKMYVFFISIFVITAFSATSVLLLPFIKLYTKGVSDTQYILPYYAYVLILSQAAYCLRNPYVALVQGGGYYGETKKDACYEAIINFSVSLLTVHTLGLIGTALGTFVANCYRIIRYIIFIDRNMIYLDKKSIFHKIIYILLLTIVINIVSTVLLNEYPSIGWCEWIISSIIVVTIAIVIQLLACFFVYKEECNEIIKLFRQFLQNR